MSIAAGSIMAVRNPIVEERADPWVLKDGENYYFTGSFPAFDRIVLRGAQSLAGLTGAEETVIWKRPEQGEMGGNIWAPELHKIDDKWYFYFTAGHSDKPFRIRMYAIEGIGADPRTATWGEPAKIETQWDEFSLDATVFEHRGDYFYVWSQRPVQPDGLPDGVVINSDIYLSKMVDPFTLVGSPTLLTSPEFDWENIGFRVNEGAAVVKRNGRIFITYSASATDHNYCMGLLTAQEDSDLTDPASWVKAPQPVFVSSDLTGAYGPGHNSFTVDDQGRDMIVYHARSYRDIVGNSLFDFNRHGRVQPFFFGEDGVPVFGLPVGDGELPVRVLAPSGRLLAVVKESIASAPTGSQVLGDGWTGAIPDPLLELVSIEEATETDLDVSRTLFRILDRSRERIVVEPVVSRGHSIALDVSTSARLGEGLSLEPWTSH